LYGSGLVKTVQFKKYTYIGDPINTVRILNEKEVDELMILDIAATREQRSPSLERIKEIAGESFMPAGYGGGIKTLQEIQDILCSGIEKVVINSSAASNPALITEAAKKFGRQSIVVSMDVKKNIFRKSTVWTSSGRRNSGYEPVEYAKIMESMGAGELLLTSIERDGTFQGYDIPLIRCVADAVTVPVIACGGAQSIQDFVDAVTIGKASAVAAGSMFVFHGKNKGILINYPSQETLCEQLFTKAS
jgi:cyclase